MKDNVVKLKAELRWAYLAKPNTEGEYATGKYQVDIVIDEQEKRKLKAFAGNLSGKQILRAEEDGRFRLTVKTARKPAVVDRYKKPMSDEEVACIGNGTTALVAVNIFEAKNQRFAGLCAVKVLELKECTSAENIFDDDEEDLEEEGSLFDDDEVLS